MSTHRFHTPPEQISGEMIQLDEDESHHLARVLRLREGETVFAFDGQGNEWECTVASSQRTASRLTIVRALDDVVESPLRLTLAQAVVKGEKFELVIQKATELGVSRIIPVVTTHCEGRRDEDRAGQRHGRWQRIALEAVKQCRRRTLVTITPPVSFTQLCRETTGPALLLSEKGGGGLPESIGSATELTMVVGPEGGWSAEELTQAVDAGFIPIHLGPRILRTETAAITAMVLAQFRYGDLHRS